MAWRWLPIAGLAVAVGVVPTGCLRQMMAPKTPLAAGYNPVELVDPVAEAAGDHSYDMKEFFALAEKVRQERKPAVMPRQRNVLALSGGGVYGSYCAGVLVGWTQTGKRPEFDVVTGISTGSLIAPLAFLGPEYDGQLREMYTTLRNDDVFRLKRTLRSLLSESLADNSPLARKIDETVTCDLLRAVAAAHARGRRLYVGTTELESRRAVIWDMGEIATRGTLEDLALFRKILLASAAIPGFFPPVRIPVMVDGTRLEEKHVDGGVTNALFFRPPQLTEAERADPTKASLHGSNVYILVAGKVYADPATVSPRALTIAANSVSTLIYSQTRGDLLKLYTACILTGMNYYISSLPATFAAPTSSTDFDPEKMAKMFDEGVRQATAGTAFRTTPPGLEKGEGSFVRVGPTLTQIDLSDATRVGRPTGPQPLFPRIVNGMPVPFQRRPIEK